MCEVQLVVDLVLQLLFLSRQSSHPAFQFVASSLVLRQRDHTTQISFRQPVELVSKLPLPLAQILASRLQLLRQPVSTVRPSQRLSDLVGMSEQLTEITPDQFIELSGRDITRRTMLLGQPSEGARLAGADVIQVMWLDAPRLTRHPALATTDQRS